MKISGQISHSKKYFSCTKLLVDTVVSASANVCGVCKYLKKIIFKEMSASDVNFAPTKKKSKT